MPYLGLKKDIDERVKVMLQGFSRLQRIRCFLYLSIAFSSVSMSQEYAQQEDWPKPLPDSIEWGQVPLKLAVSKVPIADWTALLEDSWGVIKETRFFYA